MDEGVASEDAPAAEEFRVSVPWRVVEGPEFFTVHAPDLKEVCRVPKTVRAANCVATLLAAMPWMMMALQRLHANVTVAESRKDGTTIRQWLRNHEGARSMAEIEHAMRVALDPSAADDPPRSYGVKLKAPTSAMPTKAIAKTFREMLEE